MSRSKSSDSQDPEVGAVPPAHSADVNPRANAVVHGLTATVLLPEIFGDERLKRLGEQLRAEWCPMSPTEEFLLTELARHVAALELVETAEAAVLRVGARAAEVGVSSPRADGGTDATLTAAVTTDALDRVTRYRRSHEKGVYAALLRLREARAPGRPPALELRPPEPMFGSEMACIAYLVDRMRRPGHRCPFCGHSRGYWLATRCRWQCGGCGRQSGPRAGTVMAASPLPLTIWFAAIRALISTPTLSVADLARALGIRRRATARRLAAAIRAAMESPHATERLAGLDRVALRSGS